MSAASWKHTCLSDLKRLVDGFKVKRFLQFPVTDVRCVLETHVPSRECFVWNRKREFTVFGFWGDHTVGVVPAKLSGLKAEILDVHCLIIRERRFPPES